MNAPPIAPSGPLDNALQIIDTELNRLLAQAFPTAKLPEKLGSFLQLFDTMNG
jgi:hypothetical protein